ncbi:MAG: hypothetical protein SFZ23_01835 [Planctomycetota bacterium]|nr:hypothetical protein [Planctomycetota bacterium]
MKSRLLSFERSASSLALSLCLLGGGAVGVRTQSAVGQVMPDPTPGNPALCPVGWPLPATPAPGSFCSGEWPITPLPAVLPAGDTWIPYMTHSLPGTGGPPPVAWRPDREPRIFLQFMYYGLHEFNPFGLGELWGPASQPTGPNSPPPIDRPVDRGSMNFTPEGFPQGFSGEPNGLYDQIEVFEWYLNFFYNMGNRRFVLRLPAGTVFNQDYPLNQWQMMGNSLVEENWKQRFFLGNFPPLSTHPQWGFWPNWRAAHPDARFELYTAAPVPAGLCQPCFTSNEFSGTPGQVVAAAIQTPDGQVFRWRVACNGVPEAEDFSPFDARHVSFVIRSLQPWVDAGIRGFIMDSASPNGIDQARRRTFLELAYMPYFRNQLGPCVDLPEEPTCPFPNIRFIGEVFPTIGTGDDVIDDCAVRWAPWMGQSEKATRLDWNYNTNQWDRTFKEPWDGWLFARDQSEVHLLLTADRSPQIPVPPFNQQKEPDWTFAQVGEARKRGFVVDLYNCLSLKECRYIARWYSMGPIRVADFNGDNIVNPQDAAEFEQACTETEQIIANGFQPLLVFATGDANGNGVYEPLEDRLWFYQYYNYPQNWDLTWPYETANDM